MNTLLESPIVKALTAERVSAKSVRSQVQVARRGLHQELAALTPYRNGLFLEQQAASTRKSMAVHTARRLARKAWVSGVGCAIDLVALLRQRTKEGKPVWCLANPLHYLGERNGSVYEDGNYCVSLLRGGGGQEILTNAPVAFDKGQSGSARGRKYLMPMGTEIPPIPSVARRLARDEKIQQRASWIGLLFQPSAWQEREVAPKYVDPAIIVEWQDRPQEYYCLACWGGDGPQIMEFVS